MGANGFLIFEALIEAAREKGGAADVKDVAEKLKEKFGIEKNIRLIRAELDRLCALGRVKRIENPRRVLYVPLKSPKGFRQKSLSEFTERIEKSLEEYTKDYIKTVETETREDVGAKIELETEGEEPTIAEGVLRILKGMEKDIDDIINRIAGEIINVNPRELFLRMLRGYKKLFEKYAREFANTTAAKKREKLLDRMNEIAKRIEVIYGRVLGIPICMRKREGMVGVEAIRIRVPTPSDNYYAFEIREDLVAEYLKRRIPDDTFIVFVTPKVAERYVYIGLDSSTVTVEVFVPRISQRSVDLIINAAVSTKLKGGEVPGPPDIHPKPETVSEMTTKDAEKQGYIISPYTYYSLPERFRMRLREAQMNVLEHGLALELMKELPDIIYLDGRIFPYEHTLDDYALAPHRDTVRRSIRIFRDLLDATESRKRVSKLVGVVKRGALGYLWPLIQWFAYEKGYIGEDDLFAAWQQLERVFFDGYIALKLLNAVRKYAGDDEKVPRTFAVIRRFYAMDDRLRSWFGRCANSIEKEDSDEFWQYELDIGGVRSRKTGIAGYIEEWGGDEKDGWIYSQVCAMAATAMFYFLPPTRSEINWEALERSHGLVALPRFELLVPYSLLHSNDRKTISEYLNGAIVYSEVITMDKDGMTKKEDLYVLYDHTRPYSTFVPSPVKMSHEYAVKHTHVLANVYRGFILMRVLELLSLGYGEEAESFE